MSYENLQFLAAMFAIETFLLIGTLIWFAFMFDRKIAEAREDRIALKELVLSGMEYADKLHTELCEVLKGRAETRLAFAHVSNSLTEGLASLARKNRICRTIADAKTKREKELWRKAYYLGQSEVMVLVARDWDRKMSQGRPGIMGALDKETLESLPLNLETGSGPRVSANDTCAPAPTKKAAGQC